MMKYNLVYQSALIMEIAMFSLSAPKASQWLLNISGMFSLLYIMHGKCVCSVRRILSAFRCLRLCVCVCAMRRDVCGVCVMWLCVCVCVFMCLFVLFEVVSTCVCVCVCVCV